MADMQDSFAQVYVDEATRMVGIRVRADGVHGHDVTVTFQPVTALKLATQIINGANRLLLPAGKVSVPTVRPALPADIDDNPAPWENSPWD